MQDTDSAGTGMDAEDGSTGSEDSDPTDGGSGSDGEPAGCDPDDVPVAGLVRTNREGYVNALRDVFGDAVVEDLETVLEAIPSSHVGQFRTELAPPTYAEVSAQVNAAFTVASHLTRDGDALAALSPCLADVPESADTLSDACLSAFVDTYGRRIFRRPLTDADRERLSADYDVGADHSVAEGVTTLLTAMLIDPDFLYDRAAVSWGVSSMTAPSPSPAARS